MTEQEQVIAEEIAKALSELSPDKQKYVQIFAEGVVAAASVEGKQ